MNEPPPLNRDIDATALLFEFIKRLSESSDLMRLMAAASPPSPSLPVEPAAALAGDILYGADGIAQFLYGEAKLRRKVYNLVETGRLPHFRLGTGLCARKSVLLAWIKAQEEAKWGIDQTPFHSGR